MSLADLLTEQRPEAPLLELSEALGIDAGLWRERELLDELTAPPDLRLETSLGVADPIDDLLRFRRAYAGAFDKLYLEFEEDVGADYREESEQLDLRLEVDRGEESGQPGTGRAEIESFLRRKPHRKEILFQFAINKQSLLEKALSQLGLQIQERLAPKFLFFPETAVSLFAQSWELLEGLWRREPPEKLVILVPVWGSFLHGRYLAVVGGDPRDRWESLLAEEAEEAEVTEVTEEAKEAKEAKEGRILPLLVAKARRRNLRWQTEWIRRLTPLHLQVAGKTPPGDPIARTLRLRLANLSILFTADWTELREKEQVGAAVAEPEDEDGAAGEREGLQDDELIATYAGVRQKVKLPLVDPRTELDVPDEDVDRGVDALAHLIHWCYVEKFSSDRLSLVQNTVAQALYSAEEKHHYARLLGRAPDIWDEVRWNWKAFIEGRVDEFVGQLQAVEEHVANTVEAFSKQVSEMIKALSATMLAAVAVLVSTFLASHFKDGADPKLLAIGVAVYLAYVIVFPLGFNMAQRLQSFNSMRQHFTRRRERFEQQLPSDRVEEIVGHQVSASEMWFVIWFVATLVAYLAVVLGLGWYFLPGIFG